jgi:hypothetical protein
MIPEILPIVAGLASLVAGAAKYVQGVIRSRNSSETEITIGNETVKVTGSLSKEDLATMIETLRNKAENKGGTASP